MEIGDLIFKMLGRPDPKEALLNAAAGGGGAAPQPDPAAPAGTEPPAQPQAFTSPPDLMQLYSDLLAKQRKTALVDRGIGMIGASMAFEENRPGIMEAFSGGGGGSGGGNPAEQISTIMDLQSKQTALTQKAAQRAALPAIAKQYGLDLQTAQYLFDTGKLDTVIAEAEKPNKQIVTSPTDGTSRIVDLTDGSMGESFGAPKKREIDIRTDTNTGEQFAVYKDDGSRVGGPSIVPGVRKTEYVEDPITGSKGLVYSDTKEPVPGANVIKGAGNTEDEKQWQAAQRGLPPEEQITFDAWMDKQKKSTVLSSNLGKSGIDYGDPEKGTAWKRDADGTVMTDENNTPIQVPVVGGSVEAEQKAAADQAAAGNITKKQVSDIVTTDIDRSMQIIKDNKDSYVPATGMRGWLASNLKGTPQYNAAELIETVKANVGFDKLQAMRAASPTGAALGPVSDFENKLLQQVMGSLDIGQGHEQLVYNLERVKRIYSGVITGEFVNKDGSPNTEAVQKANDELGAPDVPLDDLLKQYGG